MTVYGFGSLDDASRVINAALGIEGQRPFPRGRSGRQPTESATPIVRAKTRSTLALDGTQTVDVIVRDSIGALVPNGEEIVVHNMFGEIAGDRYIMVAMLLDGNEVIAARCPPAS